MEVIIFQLKKEKLLNNFTLKCEFCNQDFDVLQLQFVAHQNLICKECKCKRDLY